MMMRILVLKGPDVSCECIMEIFPPIEEETEGAVEGSDDASGMVTDASDSDEVIAVAGERGESAEEVTEGCESSVKVGSARAFRFNFLNFHSAIQSKPIRFNFATRSGLNLFLLYKVRCTIHHCRSLLFSAGISRLPHCSLIFT